MNLKSKQRGMSPLSILCLFVIAGFFGLLILKLAPHYIDFSTVKSVLQNTANSPDIKGASEEKIAAIIEKKLRVNSPGQFDYQEDMIIDLEAKEIIVEYDVREPVAGNADVVLKFNHVQALK